MLNVEKWNNFSKMNIYLFIISFLLFNFFIVFQTKAQETHADSIILKILDTRLAIINNFKESPDKFIFLTFWDFDGTILKGDCSEGFYIGERQIYKGLAQLAIEKGFSEIYPPIGGFEKFWNDYKNLEHNIGRWFAYPFIPQMLRGSVFEDIHRLSSRHFNDILQNYYFKSSVKILKALENNDIHCHIISASADVFIDAAASTLKMNPVRFNGIEVQIENNKLTEKLVYPVTWSDGKTEKLLSIVDKIAAANPEKQVIVLAAFGNSYSTDGPFMRYVAEQILPAGKPISVMINGGEIPEEYKNLFIYAEQHEIQSNENSLGNTEK